MGEAQIRERRAVARLLRFYRPGAGRFLRATGASWQLALAIEAVVCAYQRTGEQHYRDVLVTWLNRQGARRSRYYDDDGWYVNAWLGAYEATGDARFLTAARAGFADLLSGWDDICGGGMWWSRARSYKNAITTGLFLLAAARLARYDGGTADGWAARAWHWYDASGLINEAHLVNDGLDGCRNNGDTTWTYNQGILISGLVELSTLDRAGQIARAAIATLAPGGILREPSEPRCDRDQEIFKGVLAQGLGRLCRADPAGSADVAAFLRANADSVWHNARDADDGLGLCWAGPPGPVTPATHASATLLLTEVAVLPSS